MLTVTDLTRVFVNASDGIAGGIRNASFSLEEGQFFTLLGPSGCGKTTTLRCIAGLETPDSGVIAVNGEAVFDGERGISVPMNRRSFGMVFQSYAIWPHMSVFENVAFPLRASRQRRYSSAEIEQAVKEALRTVDLDGFQTRSATRLSGGQQQRVALARAIVARPKLLLLDEPLSNLDASLRDDMRRELKRLQRELGITTIYVTHDQSEALEMSDQIAVMEQGRIVQLGTSRDIYFRPGNRFVASFVGTTNLFSATVNEAVQADALASVQSRESGPLACFFTQKRDRGEEVAISVRPEAILLKPRGAAVEAGHNRLSGRVAANGFLGNMNNYTVAVGDQRISVKTGPELDFPEGAEVELDFPHHSTIAIPA